LFVALLAIFGMNEDCLEVCSDDLKEIKRKFD